MKTSFRPRLLTLMVLAALPGVTNSAYSANLGPQVLKDTSKNYSGDTISDNNGNDPSAVDISGTGNYTFKNVVLNGFANYIKSINPLMEAPVLNIHDSSSNVDVSDSVINIIKNQSPSLHAVDIRNSSGHYDFTRVKIIADGIDALDGININNTGNTSTHLTLTDSIISFDKVTQRVGSRGVVSTGSADITVSGSAVSGKTIGIGLFTRADNQQSNLNIEKGSVINASGQGGSGLDIGAIGGSNNNSHSRITVSDSTISGYMHGIYIHSNEQIPSQGDVVINLNKSAVQGNTSSQTQDRYGSAVLVQRKNVSLNILNGSTLTGKNGVAVYTDDAAAVNISADSSALNGNVINRGTTNISLTNNASWTGTMQNVTSMNLASGTALYLTGASTIGNLTNGGTVSLAHGTTPGNILTVGGNYTGNNGNLLFNTALGDDKSVTDKLLIKGNAAGTTNVSVSNAGGTGAKTVDGIEIIHVDGTSAADAFKQKGRIVAGAYDYTLRHRGSSWYLDSHNTDPGPGPGPDPKPDPKPTPVDHVVRPEAGSYIANQAASSMFLTTLHDRAGENRYMNVLDNEGNVTSLWLRQVGNHNRFRDSSGQLRTTGNTYVAQLGGDLAQWSSTDHDRFHLGVMAGYGNNHNNTHSTVSGHSSKGSVNGYSAGLYGTWYQNDRDNTGAYVDGQVMYSWFNNHVSGDDISAEKYKSKGVTASVETGYTFAAGQYGAQDNPTGVFIEPQAQVTWMGVKADDLTESNGTRVSSQGDDNIQTRLGVRAFMQGHNRMDNGKNRTFQPFVEVNWLHNTKRNGVTMNGVSLEQAGATNIGEMKLGVEGQLTKQTALWGGVGQQLGDKGYSSTTASVGVKYSF